MAEQTYLFMPDRRALRGSVRGMWVISTLIAIVLAIAGLFLLVTRLRDGFQSADALAGVAVLVILFFTGRSLRSLAATYVASADLLLTEGEIRVMITDKIHLTVTREALDGATITEVPPRSSFHPDREGDRAYLVSFADHRIPLRATASQYRQRGRGAFLISTDHQGCAELIRGLEVGRTD